MSVAVTAVPSTAQGGHAHCAVVSCSSDGTARMWDPDTGRPLARPIPTLAQYAPAQCAHLVADGPTPLVALAADLSVRVLDLGSQGPVGVPCVGVTDRVVSVALGPLVPGAPRLLALGDVAGTVRLWDVTTGHPASDPVVVSSGHAQGVAFGPWVAGCPLWLAAAAQDGKVQCHCATVHCHGSPVM